MVARMLSIFMDGELVLFNWCQAKSTIARMTHLENLMLVAAQESRRWQWRCSSSTLSSLQSCSLTFLSPSSGCVFSHQETNLNDLSYGVRMSAELSFVLSQYTRLANRRTDGRTERRAAPD